MKYDLEDTEEIGSRPDIMLSFLKRKEIQAQKTKFGQIYVNMIGPGKARGNHYHKKRHEWLSCVTGKIKVILQDIKTKEKISLILDSKDKPLKRLHIYPLHAHVVENISKENAIIIEYASEEHDPKKDDFYKSEIA